MADCWYSALRKPLKASPLNTCSYCGQTAFVSSDHKTSPESVWQDVSAKLEGKQRLTVCIYGASQEPEVFVGVGVSSWTVALTLIFCLILWTYLFWACFVCTGLHVVKCWFPFFRSFYTVYIILLRALFYASASDIHGLLVSYTTTECRIFGGMHDMHFSMCSTYY